MSRLRVVYDTAVNARSSSGTSRRRRSWTPSCASAGAISAAASRRCRASSRPQGGLDERIRELQSQQTELNLIDAKLAELTEQLLAPAEASDRRSRRGMSAATAGRGPHCSPVCAGTDPVAAQQRSTAACPGRARATPTASGSPKSCCSRPRSATVLGYYGAFPAAFPRCGRRSRRGPIDEVMALWSGLGYYSRARNLHRCAQTVVTEHGGRFPAHRGRAGTAAWHRRVDGGRDRRVLFW